MIHGAMIILLASGLGLSIDVLAALSLGVGAADSAACCSCSLCPFHLPIESGAWQKN